MSKAPATFWKADVTSAVQAANAGVDIALSELFRDQNATA
jgi:hypothetical protein